MEEKTVVYATDRKLYRYLPTVLNSLFCHLPEAKVYIFAEDDTIPKITDPRVTVRNMDIFSHYMRPWSPQFKYYLPFQTFIRLWLADVLEERKVLWLDVDTIVDNDISDLWNLDMRDKYVAGALDGSFNNYPYICKNYMNAGVLFLNLEEWRIHNLVFKATSMLNFIKWQYGDQDIINFLCDNHKIIIGNEYNYGRYTSAEHASFPVRIYHWPGSPKAWNSGADFDKKIWRRYYTDHI